MASNSSSAQVTVMSHSTHIHTRPSDGDPSPPASEGRLILGAADPSIEQVASLSSQAADLHQEGTAGDPALLSSNPINVELLPYDLYPILRKVAPGLCATCRTLWAMERRWRG